MQIAGQNAELPEIRRRTRWLALFFMLVFAALACRLFFLQIIEGDAFYDRTSESIIRTKVLPALRGEIRDRNGRALANTRASYNVVVVPFRLSRAGYDRLLRLISPHHKQELPDWDTFQRITESRSDRPYTLAEDVSRAVMATIETGLEQRGVKIEPVWRRVYPHGKLAAHALGYLNEVSAAELRDLAAEGYSPGDKIGRAGIERQWEPYLRGRKGMQKVLIDRRGVRRSEIQLSDLVDGPTKVPPTPGENLVLTLDIDLQKIAERALWRHRTAATVVLDVKTGRILALASTPRYDSNEMSGRLTSEAANRMFSDPYRPFRDRTLNETYGPGSTFKVISALAALEDGLVSPDERTHCNKFVQVGRRRFKCTKAHGTVNLHQALVQSCNVYFYELGMRPGMMNRLSKYAKQMGLGAPAGLGINSERPGFIPTEEWHQKRTEAHSPSQGFMIGHALNTVIGEGATRVTALQMALVYATVATEGVLWLPQIIERIESGDGTVLETFPPRVRRHVAISANTLATLKKALIGVVADRKGTAYKARSKTVKIAGKTGTSQVRTSRNPRTGEAPLPFETLDHAWFAGFAPADDPQIAFATIVEHGGHGGEAAAPVAVEIVEKYIAHTRALAEAEALAAAAESERQDSGDAKPARLPTERN